MKRSFFRDMKRSSCLICLRASISLGRRRGYSRAIATLAECPLWNFLIEEFHGMAVPSNSSRGA